MIVLIDNYDSFTYNLYQLISTLDNDVRVFRHDKISIEDICLLNPRAILLSPGPGRPEEAGICVPLIKQLSGQIPLLGICLGHQAIIHAFGGQIVNTGTVYHGKTSQVSHAHRGIFNDFPSPFQAGRYHSLMAERQSLPDVLRVDAETNDGIIMAVQHNTHPTVGLQFHPESLLTPDGALLINAFMREVADAHRTH